MIQKYNYHQNNIVYDKINNKQKYSKKQNDQMCVLKIIRYIIKQNRIKESKCITNDRINEKYFRDLKM